MPLYFAFGSCMCPEDLSRTVESSFVNTARIKNHKLAFTRYSHGRSGGVADIVKSKGDYVEGVLMIVDNFKALDLREGHPTVYKRKRISVYLNGHDTPVIAYTYVVVNREKAEVQPTEDYCEVIRSGAYKYLSDDYLLRLEETFAIKRAIKQKRIVRPIYDTIVPLSTPSQIQQARENDRLFQDWFRERYKK